LASEWQLCHLKWSNVWKRSSYTIAKKKAGVRCKRS
jgi:hypothetical protein